MIYKSNLWWNWCFPDYNKGYHLGVFNIEADKIVGECLNEIEEDTF